MALLDEQYSHIHPAQCTAHGLQYWASLNPRYAYGIKPHLKSLCVRRTGFRLPMFYRLSYAFVHDVHPLAGRFIQSIFGRNACANRLTEKTVADTACFPVRYVEGEC